MLLRQPELLDLGRALSGQPREETVHQAFGSRRSAREPDHVGAVEPGRIDLGLVVDEVGGRSEIARDLGQAVGVRRVVRTDDEHDVGAARHLLDRILAVLGRVADVLSGRPLDRGEPFAEGLDDLVGLVDRQRGLRQVGQVVGVGHLHRSRLLDGLDQDRPSGRLARGPDDLLVPGVPDQHDRPASVGEPPGLEVDLGDERAGGVQDRESSPLGVRVHLGSDAVSREHDHGALGDLGLLLDEDRALGLEIADDVRVVDDLLAHVDRRPVGSERALDGLHGSLDPGAVPARGGEQDLGRHAPMLPGASM